MSDYKGAALMLPALPNKARKLLADKISDTDWLCAALARRGIAACIPLEIQSKGHDPPMTPSRTSSATGSKTRSERLKD